MLREEDIALELKCQQYVCRSYWRDLEEKDTAFLFESTQETGEVRCPHCHGKVYADGYGHIKLKDLPIWFEMSQELTFICHRYQCLECGRKHTESIPLQHPGTRITE